MRNGFVNYDDNSYVTQNVQVQGGLSPQSVAWAFRTTHAANWHPLTWLSLELDAQLYSLHPWGYHLTNIVLHAGSALVLFHLLALMTGALWRSLFVAALFALHPLRVESVAWISERKDVLSAFLGFLTILAYVNYVERPGAGLYLWVAVLFSLGLMAKPMLVTLPFVLLLLDYWPLRRYGAANGTGWGLFFQRRSLLRLVVEKLPLISLAILSSAFTIVAQQRGEALSSMERLPISERIANALVAYLAYIQKMIWPEHLAPVYPLPRVGTPVWEVLVAASALACLTGIAVFERRRRPYLIVGWLWYLGTLVPVIGLVQVGQQAMADRYTYIPMVGLSIVLAWGLSEALEALRIPLFVRGTLAAAVLATCAGVTWAQIGHWHESVGLWRHAIEATSDNYISHSNLGMALDQLGQRQEAELALVGRHSEGQTVRQKCLNEAVEQYSTALTIKEDLAPAYFNRGVALAQLGKTEDAIRDFSEAIHYNSSLAVAYYNRGLAFKMMDLPDRAARDFVSALGLQHSDLGARRELALILVQRGDYARAAEEFALLVEKNPNDAESHSRLGTSLYLLGKHEQAIGSFRQALALQPANARHYFDLAHAYEEVGRGDMAAPYYRKGLEIDPQFPIDASRRAWRMATDADRAKRNGAVAVLLARQACEATEHRQPEMLDVLAAAYAEAGRFQDAVSAARQAIALASSSGESALVDRLATRLRVYERNQPYREPPPKSSNHERAE